MSLGCELLTADQLLILIAEKQLLTGCWKSAAGHDQLRQQLLPESADNLHKQLLISPADDLLTSCC